MVAIIIVRPVNINFSIEISLCIFTRGFKGHAKSLAVDHATLYLRVENFPQVCRSYFYERRLPRNVYFISFLW